MRILTFTAGAANMYCGSCLRDNTLASGLRRLGHDVTLLPLYTPTRTDEVNVSDPRVFFGGVSVYLEQYVPLLRHTPAVLDWLWDRPALIRAFAGRSIKTDPRMLGALTVSMLRGEAGHQRKELHKLIDWLRTEPPYDVIVLPNALLIGLAAPLARALARPVVCTLQGEDLFLEGLPEAARREALSLIRQHAAAVSRFVAVSEYYAGFMAGYLGLARDRIDVVPLGINVEGYRQPRPARQSVFTIGYFARIDPAKGLDRLCRIYRHMREALGLPRSRLVAAGFLGADHHDYLARCRQVLADRSLGDEFEYAGEVDREQKIAFLAGLDVLSVPTPYAEPKALFILEAMAAGVPVVQPDHGAFPEILARTGGGLLVANDEEALAEGLMRIWRDPGLAGKLGRSGVDGVRAHYSADHMASAAADAYGRAASRPTAPAMATPE